jgi:zinc transport system ATP-binding protein
MIEITKNPVVSLEGVDFRYGSQTVLEDIDLQIEPNDFVGMIGPNGGGKTTLLKLMLGLLKPQAGLVKLFGLPPARGRRFAGYVPQGVHFDRDFPISVMDVALMGRLRHAPRLSRYRAEDREAAEQALEQMEVLDLRRRRIGDLSGGQIQRVMIARALAGRPRLLALDEPTANIDTRLQQEIQEILRRLNERMTIVLISHDLGFVSGYVNRVVCLNRRLVCHPVTHLTGNVIDELYHGHVHMVDHGDKC